MERVRGLQTLELRAGVVALLHGADLVGGLVVAADLVGAGGQVVVQEHREVIHFAEIRRVGHVGHETSSLMRSCVGRLSTDLPGRVDIGIIHGSNYLSTPGWDKGKGGC